TRSPGANPLTPSPTATISPETSCPRIEPAFLRTYQSRRSDPQMPATRVRIKASPGPMSGTGTSTTATPPSASTRTAFMRRRLPSLPAGFSSARDRANAFHEAVDLVLRGVTGAARADQAVGRVAQTLHDRPGVEIAAGKVEAAAGEGLGGVRGGDPVDHERNG